MSEELNELNSTQVEHEYGGAELKGPEGLEGRPKAPRLCFLPITPLRLPPLFC